MASTAPFSEFLATLDLATNETQKREAFITLAAQAYADSGLARDMSLGAEYRVAFEKSGAVRRGLVDCYFGNLVIEFENNMSATGAHAVEQLRGYVAGAWTEDGGTGRPYLAVASDGRHWQVFTPTPRDPAKYTAVENVKLELNDEFVASNDNPEALADFLNRLFFRQFLLKPTAANFTRDFGLASPSFMQVAQLLRRKLDELGGDPQLLLLKEEWAETIGVAYGGPVHSDELFVRHTYLASLARLLVYAALERRTIADAEVEGVLNGDYFRARQVANMAEDDFFAWHQISSPTDVARTWVAIAKQLAGYDLGRVKEDILKPLYETLVDPDFRHDLGEYYTPDWLAERAVGRLYREWDAPTPPSVIDPACGSGTFLRACIEQTRSRSSATGPRLLQEVVQSVVGVDVHPLAVIIARATYLLGIADLVAVATDAVTLPVFLADALEAVELEQRFNSQGVEEIYLELGRDENRRQFPVPVDFVRSIPAFDGAIEQMVEIAESFAETQDAQAGLKAQKAILGAVSERLAEWPGLAQTLSEMCVYLVELIRLREDSVWGFILRNRHRPTMLRNTFDFVVGNPPWLTLGSIEAAGYRARVKKLAQESGVAPRAAGEQAHTELATLFIPRAFRLLLRENPRSSTGPCVGFVMPRSVMSATHHRLLREGTYRDEFRVGELWDLDDVTPLFNVPSCVVFMERGRPDPLQTFPYLRLKGRLPSKEAPVQVAKKSVKSTNGRAGLVRLGKRSAWAGVPGRRKTVPGGGLIVPPSDYKELFRQGAILYPQVLLVVVAKDGRPISRKVKSVGVVTDPAARVAAKLLRTVEVDHLIESESCFSTYAAEHVGPYATIGTGWTVVLPVLGTPGSGEFYPVGPDALRMEARTRTARWLVWAEANWEEVRKPDEKLPLWERIDYMGQLTAQATRDRYLVLFTSSGSRTFATVVDSDATPLPFVARDKTYWASFSAEAEAHYVAAFVNADTTLRRIENFMTRGLMGPRDAHTRVLDVPFPAYDPDDARHADLAALGASLAAEARKASLARSGARLGLVRRHLWDAMSPVSLSSANDIVAELSAEREAVNRL